MSKFIQNLFLFLLPFYPFWAWLCFSLTNKPFEVLVSILLIPIAIYFLLFGGKKLPIYLILLILFSIYHLCSAFINDTIPKDTSKIYFILQDFHIRACLFFIIIENSIFNKQFINRMSTYILITVVISVIVSIVQIKIPTFFFNTSLIENSRYLGDSRSASVYSWTNLNSLGISFPILVSILVSIYNKSKSTLSIVIFSGIVVSFLSKARFVMISSLVVLSQLFINTKISIVKKVSFIVIFLVGIYLFDLGATQLGYNISDVVNNRILEKETDMESAKARITSYEVFMIVFPENPWFGVGPETRQNVIDMLGGEAPLIHIGYLSYLYFYGLIGSLILFGAIFFLVRDAWIVGRRCNFWGVFYGLISFCIANLTFVYFNLSEMGIVISLIYLRYYSYKFALDSLDNLIGKKLS